MSEIPIDTKGKRPAFFEDPAIDTVMTALLEVMAENWTLKERVKALEKCLYEKGVLDEDAVESVTWTDAEKMALETQRQDFLREAFRALKGDFVSRAKRQEEIDG